MIVSSDTRRTERLPPNQQAVVQWPPLQHPGGVPDFDPQSWDFSLFPKPLVDEIVTFSWAAFSALPRVRVLADLHSVQGWSKLDIVWEGVATRELLNHVKIAPDVSHVMVHSDHGFTANLSVDDFFDDDCVFALKQDGQDLSPEQGRPVRLIVPKLYSWKSAPWVRGTEFMTEDRPGHFESWQNGGHHLHGDPWQNERFRDPD